MVRTTPGEIADIVASMSDGQVIVVVRDVSRQPVPASLANRLHPDEVSQSERFRFDADRRRFVAGRALARHLLSASFSVPAEQILFATDAFGRPRVAGGAQGVDFNVSHSGDLVLVAVARNRKVGVDVEQWRERLDFKALASVVFSTVEQADLLETTRNRQQCFYRYWACKEAWLKCDGRGLSLPPESFTIRPTSEPGWHSVVENNSELPARICELPIREGYTSAVAAEGAAWSVTVGELIDD
jgi:4'-phosphopantetheinyl transferase